MAMNNESFLELEVEEQLFDAVVHSPFEECEKLLLKHQDVNIKSGSGRSLLHIAVRLGKLDWVEGLLGHGADPSLVDNRGFTVLEVAEDMTEKRPEDYDVKLILRFVRVASKVGCSVRENVETSAEKSSAVISDLKTDVDLRNEISSLQGSVDELRKESATQIGDLRQDLLQSSVRNEISSLQSVLDQLRKDTATQIGDLRQDLLQSSVRNEISSLQSVLDQLRKDTATQIGDLRQDLLQSSVRNEISSLQGVLDQLQKDTANQIGDLRQDLLQSSVRNEISSLQSVLDQLRKDTATQIGDLHQDMLHSSVRNEISSLQGVLDQLRNDTATQIGVLCDQQLSSAEEISLINENIQSLTECVSSVERASQTARGDIVILIDDLSQRMLSSGIDISSVKQNFNSFSADTSLMRDSLTDLRSDMTSLAGEITSMRSVLGEVKREVHSVVTRRESDTSGQLNSLKKAVEEVGLGLTARDTLLEALETSVTSLAERMAPAGEENKGATTELLGASKAVKENKKEVKSKDNRCGPTTSDSVANGLQTTVSSLAESSPKHEALNQMSMSQGAAESVAILEEDDEEYISVNEVVEGHDEALIGTASGVDCSIIQTSDEKDCMRCVEAITNKTWIYNDDNDKVTNVRRLYKIIYQTSPLTSCVLSFLAYHPAVGVSMDFTSSEIKNMITEFENRAAVSYYSGAVVNSLVDFIEQRVYVGVLVETSEAIMLSHFMKSLTELALFLVFNNMGRPYFQHDKDLKVEVREIYDEGHRKRIDEMIHFDWYLHKALDAHDIEVDMLLIAAVPAIIVKCGSEGGSKLLDQQLPSLLDFYMDHIMFEFHNASIKLQEGS